MIRGYYVCWVFGRANVSQKHNKPYIRQPSYWQGFPAIEDHASHSESTAGVRPMDRDLDTGGHSG